MGDDPVYVKSTCFDPFPLPADVPKPLQGNIRDQAEALDALRKRVLESHQDLTLTRLYNVLEALKEGRPLTEAERDIHDRGLVTLICQHHDTIDALVAERSEEHTSELQSLMRISYAVFCLKKKKTNNTNKQHTIQTQHKRDYTT